MLINEAMRLERERHLAVAPYERSTQRMGYANGYKPQPIEFPDDRRVTGPSALSSSV